MINQLNPSLVVIGVPPMEQEKILEFLLKKKRIFYVKNLSLKQIKK